MTGIQLDVGLQQRLNFLQVELVELAHAFAGGFRDLVAEFYNLRKPILLIMRTGKLIIEVNDTRHGGRPVSQQMRFKFY